MSLRGWDSYLAVIASTSTDFDASTSSTSSTLSMFSSALAMAQDALCDCSADATALQVHRRLEGAKAQGGMLIFDIIMVALCIIGAALAAGLTQGLLSISPLEMNIKMRSGSEMEKGQAKRILPLITKHHLLLVTLMLFNATANEALPIFLDNMVPAWLAIVLSVSLVLLFGEIIPSAIFTGPNQIFIASFLTPFVWLLIAVLYPIAYPISLLLDAVLGHDDGLTIFNRTEIVTMMRIQQEEAPKRGVATQDAVMNDEVNIIDGALNLREMMVESVMTTAIFMLSIDETLNLKTLSNIFQSGYSRIPIYEQSENDVVGLLLVKDLLFIDPDDDIPIRNFMSIFGRPLQSVWADEKLTDVLHTFKRTRTHMAIVKGVNDSGPGDPFYEVKGIITMEDIIEAILGTEILDETDSPDDNRKIKEGNRNVDFANLKLLTNNMTKDQKLSMEETKAVISFLESNVPQVRKLFGAETSTAKIRELVQASKVMNINSRRNNTIDYSGDLTSSGMSQSTNIKGEYLYKRGKVSTACTLILSGKVTVLAGKDEFQIEMGPWSILGADVLVTDEGLYSPDFSAFISSVEFRCLRILKPASPHFQQQHKPHEHNIGGGSGRGRSLSAHVSSPSAAAAIAAAALAGPHNTSSHSTAVILHPGLPTNSHSSAPSSTPSPRSPAFVSVSNGDAEPSAEDKPSLSSSSSV